MANGQYKQDFSVKREGRKGTWEGSRDSRKRQGGTELLSINSVEEESGEIKEVVEDKRKPNPDKSVEIDWPEWGILEGGCGNAQEELTEASSVVDSLQEVPELPRELACMYK